MLLCGCQSFIKESYLLTHTRLTALCLGLPRWTGTTKVKPIWILLEQEIVSGSGISWATCKSAPRSRQITTPVPHHSVFLQAGCPSCRPTNSVKALKAQQRHCLRILWRRAEVMWGTVCVQRRRERQCWSRSGWLWGTTRLLGRRLMQLSEWRPTDHFPRRRRVLFMRCVIYQCYQLEDAFWGLCVCLYSLHIIYSCSAACFLLQVI